MKSVPLPSRDSLSKAYEEIQWAREPVDAERIVQWAHWSRLDARLAELLVRYLLARHGDLNPFVLWQANRRSPQPQALAVLVEFARILARETRSPEEETEFRVWSRIILKDLAPAEPQMFFLREGKPLPDRDFAVIETSLLPYRRWGFFGNEAIGAGKRVHSQRLTLMGKAERKRILDKLLQEKPRIRVDEYIQACGGRVHRRTAERDLAQDARLERMGITRASMYLKRRRRRS